jgi:sec-independent protein translocase protein TatC
MAEEKLQEMSFWDHVDALRSVLIRIVVVLVLLTIGLFALMPSIFDQIILAPCHGDFVLYRLFERMTSSVSWLPQFSTEGFNVDLINIKLASQFFIHMSTSFWLALVLAFPIVLYFLWSFVARRCTRARSVASRRPSSSAASCSSWVWQWAISLFFPSRCGSWPTIT